MLKIYKLVSKFKKQPKTRDTTVIRTSKLFDEEWYLEQYPDVKGSGHNPILHYVMFGALEGRFPNPDFDSLWYLDTYKDVANAGINPLVHYIENGKEEGRLCNGKGSLSVVPSNSNAKVSISELGLKLWGGFSRYSIKELENASKDKTLSNKERSLALYTLGRWFSSNLEWQKAYDNLKLIRKLDIKFYRAKRTKLLLIEALLQLGLKDKARNFIEETIAIRFDSDFLCSSCNEELEADKRLLTLNIIYSHWGLAELTFRDSEQGFTFGNVDVVKTLPKLFGPKISILVPVYNAQDFISVAIMSLLAQTWQNIEIIAVDDCSSDESIDILELFAKKDKRLRVVRNEVNIGAYGTRNKALSLATGEFITVHDSDDWSHPQMLEIQMGAMMSNPRLKVTCSMMARVDYNLRFALRPQRNNLDYVHRSYPSVLIRKKDLSALGEWDGVSANADDEFVQRARILWGNDSVQDILKEVPLSFFLVHENSLTQNKKTSLNSLTFGIRHEYSRQAKYWKEIKVGKDSQQIITNRKSLKEPFPIPAGLAPNNWQLNTHYDLVIVSDLSLLGGTRRCNEGYISAALNSGLRVGLFHWPRYDLKISEIAKEYTELTYRDNVDMLVHEDTVTAGLVIIHHPPILKYELDALPTISCDNVGILVNQSPMQLWSQKPHYYNEKDVGELCLRWLNKKPVWIPISPIVEKTLKVAGGSHLLHLSLIHI